MFLQIISMMKSFFLALAISCFAGHIYAQQITPQTQLLLERNKEFKKEIIRLADNVYTVVGYDVSNVTMIEGDDGLVLIDAGMVPQLASEIYEEFRKISDKPIKDIIFTHGHGDHTRGLPAFIKDNNPRIWAAENFGSENNFSESVGFKNPRSYRQSGMRLHPDQRINNGIAPAIYPGGKYKSNFSDDEVSIYPSFNKNVITDYVSSSRQEIIVSGISLEVVRCDGETSDHLVVWYPDKKIIFPGDLFYKSFPNLYAIRGTDYRDVNNWIKSLDILLQFDADIMAQGHTRPIIGKIKVKEALTNYRDAISFVFNKTIEGMNKGMTPDELVEYVQLPEKFAQDPNLIQYYGRVEWAVRNIYNGYLGWFDGNPTNLRPLSPKKEAEYFVGLVGSIEKIESKAKQAISDKDFQWAAELADKLLAIEPDNIDFKKIKADALRGLANNIETALGRNYYLTVANELDSETK